VFKGLGCYPQNPSELKAGEIVEHMGHRAMHSAVRATASTEREHPVKNTYGVSRLPFRLQAGSSGPAHVLDAQGGRREGDEVHRRAAPRAAREDLPAARGKQ